MGLLGRVNSAPKNDFKTTGLLREVLLCLVGRCHQRDCQVQKLILLVVYHQEVAQSEHYFDNFQLQNMISLPWFMSVLLLTPVSL